MAERDQNRMSDGALSLEGGMDSGRSPSLLEKNQTAFNVNTTVRGGFAKSRPPFIRRALDFNGDTEIESLFNDGDAKFQHGTFFDGTGLPVLICVLSGRFFLIKTDSFRVQEFTILNDANPSDKPMGWSVQAENYWIYQDNETAALIFDGASARRADRVKKEVPVGNVMGYGMGRITVALRDRMTFRIGDLVFGPTGTANNGFRDAILTFTENDYLNEGGDFTARIFGAPSNSGPITAIKYFAALNTSLGQGPMMVGTTNTVFTINAPFDRTVWKNLASPIQSVAMVNFGPTGQDSTVPVNGDIFYRAVDGERSFIQAYRYFGQPGNTSISSEMDRVFNQDDQWLLEFASGVVFDNRLLHTCSPVLTDNGCYHRALAVMDFDLISSLRQKLPPVWEGIWTKLKFLKLTTGVIEGEQRCFTFVLGDDNDIQLWELLRTGCAETDDDDLGTKSRIERVLELASYNFSTPFDLKRLDGAQIFIEDVKGEVDFNIKYREDKSNCWHDWYARSVCATKETCNPIDCAVPANLQPQSRPKNRVPTPPDVNDSVNGKLTRVGYEFQPRIAITGACTLKGFRLNAYQEQELPGYETTTEDCEPQACCPPSTTP